MSALTPWRRELRALIPRGFLRRDQDAAYLFVSDYPRFPEAERVTRSLAEAGFLPRITGSLCHLQAADEKYIALFAALPCPATAPRDDTLYAFSLAQRLLKADVPLEKQPLRLLGQWMKRLDGADARAVDDIAACCALYQRRRLPLPSAAGKLILYALSDLEGGDGPC